MYQFSTISICVLLLAMMMLSVEVGRWIGKRRRATFAEADRSQINAIQAAILGLFALLLGFTFTMSVQRYDGRTAAVADEANAIGTAYLRSDLLEPADGEQARSILRRYVDLRVQAGGVSLPAQSDLDELNAQAAGLQNQLWSLGVSAAEADPNPVTAGLYLQAVNTLIDAQGSRSAALQNHVPEPVLLLLMTVFVTGGGVVGYATGLSTGRRPLFATLAMTLLIVLVVFVVVDLDRPRRGLIQTNQTSLLELRSSIAE